jgi:DNA-binding NtrC family response regulator
LAVAGKQSSNADTPPPSSNPFSSSPHFRWQAIFQRVEQPLFILSRNRRILFVNRAWEEFTGLPFADVRGLVCTRQGLEMADRPSQVARTLCPPTEVREGKLAHVRRQIDGLSPAIPGWWDIEFFPLRGKEGVACIVGRISGVPHATEDKHPPYPEALKQLHDEMARDLAPDEAAKLWSVEKIVAMRERLVGRYRIDNLESPLPAMRRVADQARLASSIRSCVYLVGEAGTGKAWLARAIHQNGPDRERAFARVDCARLPAGAVAEILFGGTALLQRPGIGTIYLNSPSRLPQDVQSRLHDWLERGSTGQQDGRARIITGSSRPPLAEVHAGRLLEKLYGALATLVIELPPLRDRLADLPNLVDRMLDRLNELSDRRISSLTAAAWETFREYRWPGNLRELYSVLSACHETATGERIDAPDLPAFLRQAVRLDQTPAAPPEDAMPLDSLLERVERRLIEVALHRARGNKSRAAELLAVWRPRLLRRIEALGIDQESWVRSQESGVRSQESESGECP